MSVEVHDIQLADFVSVRFYVDEIVLSVDATQVVIERTSENETIVRRLLSSGSLTAIRGQAENLLRVLHTLAELGWIESTSLARDEIALAPQLSRNRGVLAAMTSPDPYDCSGLLSTRVGILGLGGLGTVVLDCLARAGVGNFVLVDSDSVRKVDLNRQILYSCEEMGAAKVDVAKRRTRSILPHVGISTSVLEVRSPEDLSEFDNCDFLVQCADRPTGRIMAWTFDWSEESGIPFAFGGVAVQLGFWALVQDAARCRANYGRTASADSAPEDSAMLTASLSTTNMAIGSLMSHDVLDYLLGNRSMPSLHNCISYDFRKRQMANSW